MKNVKYAKCKKNSINKQNKSSLIKNVKNKTKFRYC